jgi:hypothetical protein
LIKNYVLYDTIINRKYAFNGKSLYLYEVLSSFVNDTTDFTHIIALFKIFQFYNKLSFTVKQNREKYFNMALAEKFSISSTGIGQKFITTIMTQIDSLIIEVSKTTDTNKAATMLASIRDAITMGLALTDKVTFLVTYRKHLTQRLLTQQSDADIELELLKTSINYKDDPEIYTKMKYQISDISIGKQHYEYYKTLDVRPKPNSEYSKIDFTTLKRDVCKFTTLRSYAWDDVITKTAQASMQLPTELRIYIDIFLGYYSQRFDDRKLAYNHDTSSGIIKVEINGKTYELLMTLSQLAVFSAINTNISISAMELQNKLNIPLPKLGPILNSLIIIKLVHRNNGPANDPNVSLVINRQFTHPDNKLSLIGIYNKLLSMPTSKVPAGVNETVAKAKLLAIMHSKKEASLIEIKKELDSKLNTTLPDGFITYLLDHFIKANRITQNNDTYSFVQTKTTDSDSDSDD